ALGETEARLVELRRADATASAEVEELESALERAARAATQRLDERSRAENREQETREEVAVLQAERERGAERLRGIDERLTGLGEGVTALRSEGAAVEAAAGRIEAERVAREALRARIQAEIASTTSTRDSAIERVRQLDGQRTELEASQADL